ncbi:MAG: ABC transporter ATP-binding protein [Chloroflexi bacterium]|nr:ABC transporter ATP-binding protein [Chloroflexota bacterium]
MLSPNENSAVALTHTAIALQLRGVSKTFASDERDGREVEALAPVDLDVRTGELVCLLGASGCGKSTLLSLIAGLERATGGTILCNGKEVLGTAPDRVLLFQEAALFPWLTVQENVEFGLRQADKSRAERAEVARYWIERVRLQGFEHAYSHQLSGGMRQRVALARSLAIDPAVLLMDEPFGALDALTRDRLHAELESLWAATHKTILFVTHNVREAVALGERVLVFSPRPGRIVGEFEIGLPRPRSLEDPAVVAQTARIMNLLRLQMSDFSEKSDICRRR